MKSGLLPASNEILLISNDSNLSAICDKITLLPFKISTLLFCVKLFTVKEEKKWKEKN